MTGTVAGGYVLAWWRSEVKAIVIRAIDASGRGIGEISDVEISQPKPLGRRDRPAFGDFP